MKIFKMIYGMDNYFTRQYGDEYLCENIDSLTTLFERLVEEDEVMKPEEKVKTIEKFYEWKVRRLKFYWNETIQITESDDNNIMIEEITLI